MYSLPTDETRGNAFGGPVDEPSLVVVRRCDEWIDDGGRI
jgi:hypothetical protein